MLSPLIVYISLALTFFLLNLENSKTFNRMLEIGQNGGGGASFPEDHLFIQLFAFCSL
jgi:hypothetical protein